MKKIIGFILIILIIAGGVILVKKRKKQMATLNTPVAKAVTVNVIKPLEKTIEETRVFIGRYYSVNQPVIMSKVAGFLKKVYVKEGDFIKKGKLLAQIDDREIQETISAQKSAIKALKSSIESLKVNLAALKNDYLYSKSVYERNLELYNADALAKEKLDLSKVSMELKLAKLNSTQKTIQAKEEELKTLQANLRAKETLLNYTSLISPIDGVITKIFLREGDFVAIGKPILQISGNKKRVEFYFPENLKDKIRKGTSVYLNSQKFSISKILPKAFKNLMVAYIDLPKPLNMSEDSNIKVSVILRKAKGITIPLKAIFNDNYTFIYKNGKFELKKINILAKDEKFAVLSEKINFPVAIGSNDKLAKLLAIKKVKVVENE